MARARRITRWYGIARADVGRGVEYYGPIWGSQHPEWHAGIVNAQGHSSKRDAIQLARQVGGSRVVRLGAFGADTCWNREIETVWEKEG